MPYTFFPNKYETMQTCIKEMHSDAESEDENYSYAENSLLPSAKEEDSDPLDKLSFDEAVWAYQRMPHDDLPLWEPKPTRPWLEPLIRLIDIGAPLLSTWLQAEPLFGPLPEPRQSGLVVDEPWKRLYTSMNTMEHREPLIVAMKKALDEWEQGQEIQEGGYAGELHRGRKLVQRLEENASEALDEVLAREVLDYLILSDLVAIRSEKSTRDAASLDVMYHSCNEGACQACICAVPGDFDGKAGHVASGGGVTAPLVSVVVAGAASSVGRPVMYESIAVLQAAPSAVSSLAAAVRSATSSSMLRKTALGSLLIGVPAGAYGLYKWIIGANESDPVGMENSLSSTKQGIKQKPFQQEELMELFEELDVPYLDFLFELEPRELENGAQAHWRPNQAERVGVGSTVSPGDDQEYRMGVQERIDEHPETQDFIMDPLGFAIFEQLKSVVNLSPEIERAKWLSKNEKDVVYLLKLIEVADIFSREFSIGHSNHPIMLALHRFVDGLRAIAERLPGEFSETKVSEFKQTFGWGDLNLKYKVAVDEMNFSLAETVSLAPARRRGRAISDTDFDPVEEIINHGGRVLQDIETAYDPILVLADYLDRYIDNLLSIFNRENRVNFTKNDKVRIRLLKKPTGIIITWRMFYEHYFSIKDIVTGRYRLIIKDKLIEENIPKVMVFEQCDSHVEDELVRWLWQKDLQISMMSALNDYRGRDGREKRYAFSRVLRGNIISRCLAYLDSPLRRPGFDSAVRRFVAGDEIAREVLFEGVPLHGVFFIPYGTASGVLFSVDEEAFFHIDEVLASQDQGIYEYLISNAVDLLYDFPLPKVPSTAEFRAFVINRLPAVDAERYRNSSFDGSVRREMVDPIISGDGAWYKPTTPFSFRYSEGIQTTADIAIYNYLQRIERDIDSLVYSPGEEAEILRMETIKRVLFITSLALSTAIPSFGAIWFRICLWGAHAAIDVAYVLATLRQHEIVDDPESAEAYYKEAIIAGTVSALVNVVPGGKLGVSGVRRAMKVYRGVKRVGSEGIAALSAKMSWGSLPYREQLTVLENAVKRSDEAVELVRLDGSSEVLGQVIRRAVPEGVVLRNMDTALMHVRTGLKSELSRLRGPNIISLNGLRPARLSPFMLKQPRSFLGPDSSITFINNVVVVRAHGAPAAVNSLPIDQLVFLLRGHAAARGVNWTQITMIRLESCYGAFGNKFSTGSRLAEKSGKLVMAYEGKVTPQMIHNNPSLGKVFRPTRPSRGIINPDRGHAFLYRASMVALRIRSMLAHLHRVPRGADESEARRPPHVDRPYKNFLLDAVNLIEGRYDVSLFCEVHEINVEALTELMSHINARSDMDDEGFFSCFDKLFSPGKTRSEQGTVLFHKLFEYADPMLMESPQMQFNARQRPSNSDGEINKGEGVLIDYHLLDGQLDSNRNWVGLYRLDDLPSIEPVISWKFLEGSGGSIEIDTSSLEEGAYTAKFFFNGSYDELGGGVYFYVRGTS
ncbi:hypothetical protein [Aeromonas sp. SG16]|uniref:hypothetical protein n=1 Tax=Aeromonas sp. SG16 TaxID=2950548 RepID=UPI00210A08FB|nr:hypothetical protein [Aeromonas sp. SG16]MCQ4053557.1 hypothetical protein [Aeromonas sp. SG16]